MPAAVIGLLRCGVPLFENQLYGCVAIHAHVKVIVSLTVLASTTTRHVASYCSLCKCFIRPIACSSLTTLILHSLQWTGASVLSGSSTCNCPAQLGSTSSTSTTSTSTTTTTTSSAFFHSLQKFTGHHLTTPTSHPTQPPLGSTDTITQELSPCINVTPPGQTTSTHSSVLLTWHVIRKSILSGSGTK